MITVIQEATGEHTARLFNVDLAEMDAPYLDGEPDFTGKGITEADAILDLLDSRYEA